LKIKDKHKVNIIILEEPEEEEFSRPSTVKGETK